jgi:hypothetical protein
MTAVSYEGQRKIFYGNGRDYTKPQEMIHELYLKDKKMNLEKFNKLIKNFRNDIGEYLNGFEKDFFIKEKINGNIKAEIDFKEIEKDFDKAREYVKENIKEEKFQKMHLGLIDKYEMEIKVKVIGLMEKSKNVMEFIDKINKDKVLGTYTSFLKNYLHMPDENNVFEMKTLVYSVDNKIVENIDEIIKNASKHNPTLSKEINKYTFESRDFVQKFIDLEKMKEKNSNLYYLFMYYFIPEDVKVFEKDTIEILKSNKEINIESTKSEIERKTQPEIKQVGELPFPTKSPTAEETKAFKNELKGSSALTRVYQEKINEYLKENEPKTKKLIVDGMFGDNSEKWLNHVAGDKIWTIMEREKQKPHTQNEIYQEIGKNIWENKNELDKGKFKRGKSEFESFKKYVLEQEKGFGTGKKYNLNNREEFNNAWKVFGGSFIERNVKQRIETKDIEKKHKTIPRY